MGEIAVELKDVYKRFGDFEVLKGVSCAIPAGQTTVIMGPSGTGKSVLIKHVVGLLQPDAGEVLVFGQDVPRLKEAELYRLRERIGMLFQDGALFDSMTVGENVGFPLVHHTKKKQREIDAIVEEKLRLVGLKDAARRYPSELSGGMRKRVGLARAIALEPDLVVFDEPHSGLDPMTADAIDDLILDMKRALGITFLVISHDIAGVFKIADHAGMLYQGELIAWGPRDEVRVSEHPIVKRFLSRTIPEPRPAEAPPAAAVRLVGGSHR